MKLKKLLIPFYFILSTLYLFSCGPNEPGDPPELVPIPGYQHDIPWPSLADSPWPMEHGNPQSTGRSKYPGPDIGEIEFQLKGVNITSGISIGADSTIYFLSNYPNNGLYAVSPTGKIKWINREIVNNQDMVATPIISSTGTIYITGGESNNLYAINSSGTVKWIYNANNSIYFRGISIGIDGTIYFVDRTQFLYAINDYGELKWKIYNENFGYGFTSGIVFSTDGSTLYVTGRNPTLFAIDIMSHEITWSFGNFYGNSLPIINSQNLIYIHSIVDSINGGTASLFCLNPNGSIKWSYPHGNKHFFEPNSYYEGTIDNYGNYYFTFDSLYSIDYDGMLRWKTNLKGYHQSPLVCDKNNNIYLSIEDENRISIDRYVSIDFMGNIRWILNSPPDLENGFSPAIGFNNDIYFPPYKSNSLIKIK
ncbi:MAG: PQQ-binding-like beta-propeller repeat protein [Bacteroidetes bacterium]|nr:PQQ-binding-like beta-propeller repeat protein [Bacteroidota bacterium]